MKIDSFYSREKKKKKLFFIQSKYKLGNLSQTVGLTNSLNTFNVCFLCPKKKYNLTEFEGVV